MKKIPREVQQLFVFLIYLNVLHDIYPQREIYISISQISVYLLVLHVFKRSFHLVGGNEKR